MQKPNSAEMNLFRQLAYLSMSSALTSLVVLAGVSILVTRNAELLHQETVQRSIEYLTKTEVLWIQMNFVRERIGRKSPTTLIRYSRSYDSFKEIVNKCNSCVRLACPPGAIGPMGELGMDGIPGTSGEQGSPGDDGVDIILGPFPDFPCVVCPGGPPGPRGEVGERGWAGEPGTKGVPGPSGTPGRHGLRGNVGATGKPGPDGQPGPAGPEGDTVIGGTGVKGPRGARGKPGLVGPIGTPGRPSNILGRPGAQGEIGSPGPRGDFGHRGPQGIVGVPGEMGAIQPFCISDCSKTKLPASSALPSGPIVAAAFGASMQQFAFPLAFAPPSLSTVKSADAQSDDYYDAEPIEVLNGS